MLFWTVANIVSAAIVCWVAAYLLVRHRHKLNVWERVSMGVVAGCMCMRSGPVLGKLMDTDTPFDYWASTLMYVAMAVLFVCWAIRLERVAVWR